MANEPQQVTLPVAKFKSILSSESIQEQFKNALGDHKDLFAASLIDLFTNDKQLQLCNPADIVKEALRAATLKLPLNKALGFAYVVVYNNSVPRLDENGREVLDPQTHKVIKDKVPTPTFIPGYKGYIQLAMRTGQYKTINADVVYEGELRKASKLTGEIDIDESGRKSDKIIGYFCYFELLNGFSKTKYVSVEDMADYALRYAPAFSGKFKPTRDALIAAARKNEPSKQVGWSGNFNDMAIKTVVRGLLSKYGYLSIEMQSALTSDIEDAQAERNDLIASSANKKAITEVSFEEVDQDTGEVKQPAAEPQATGPQPEF